MDRFHLRKVSQPDFGHYAIALSLPAFPNRDPEFFEYFVALVTGAVLFTLLVQGLTIERVAKHFGMDRPPLSDRVARIEGILWAKDRTIEQLPELQAGGLFSRITPCVPPAGHVSRTPSTGPWTGFRACRAWLSVSGRLG